MKIEVCKNLIRIIIDSDRSENSNYIIETETITEHIENCAYCMNQIMTLIPKFPKSLKLKKD